MNTFASKFSKHISVIGSASGAISSCHGIKMVRWGRIDEVNDK